MWNFLDRTLVYLWLGNLGVEFLLIFLLKPLKVLRRFEIFSFVTDLMLLGLSFAPLQLYTWTWVGVKYVQLLWIAALIGRMLVAIYPGWKRSIIPVTPFVLVLFAILGTGLPEKIKEVWDVTATACFIFLAFLLLGWVVGTRQKFELLFVGEVILLCSLIFSFSQTAWNMVYTYSLTSWFVGAVGLVILLVKKESSERQDYPSKLGEKKGTNG